MSQQRQLARANVCVMEGEIGVPRNNIFCDNWEFRNNWLSIEAKLVGKVLGHTSLNCSFQLVKSNLSSTTPSVCWMNGPSRPRRYWTMRPTRRSSPCNRRNKCSMWEAQLAIIWCWQHIFSGRCISMWEWLLCGGCSSWWYSAGTWLRCE